MQPPAQDHPFFVGLRSNEVVTVNTTCNNDSLVSKSEKQHRLKYLQKLTYSQVWLPPSQHLKTHQNLFILDWDDTLLPTSFFLRSGDDCHDLQAMARNNMQILNSLQRAVLELLEKMIMFGRVIIVTNAKQGWVEYSSYYMLPRVSQLIELYIPVISAQTQFEK